MRLACSVRSFILGPEVWVPRYLVLPETAPVNRDRYRHNLAILRWNADRRKPICDPHLRYRMAKPYC